MPRLVTVRLGRDDMKIPLPDRGGRLAVTGDTVDAENPFYAGLLRDRDLVPIPEGSPTAAAAEPAEPRRRRRSSGKV